MHENLGKLSVVLVVITCSRIDVDFQSSSSAIEYGWVECFGNSQFSSRSDKVLYVWSIQVSRIFIRWQTVLQSCLNVSTSYRIRVLAVWEAWIKTLKSYLIFYSRWNIVFLHSWFTCLVRIWSIIWEINERRREAEAFLSWKIGLRNFKIWQLFSLKKSSISCSLLAAHEFPHQAPKWRIQCFLHISWLLMMKGKQIFGARWQEYSKTVYHCVFFWLCAKLSYLSSLLFMYPEWSLFQNRALCSRFSF